jgi:ABC-type sulfate/molybdate transport systems ATPase subunit
VAGLVLDQILVPLRSFDVRLTLEVDRTVALVGPSGAGKTTILRAVAGLTKPQSGTIAAGDETWFDHAGAIDVPVDKRAVGFLFQDYALFPHLTVRKNIEFARRHKADEYLERFGIRHLEDARPAELSGGERQRVSLARALARDPKVLLLDEPLAALDSRTKTTVRRELQEVLGGLDIPTLFVTHDFEDAAALADRVGVLVDGQLRQIGSTQELVARPADPFVASFTGANLLQGTASSGNGLARIRLEDGTVISTADSAAGKVVVAVYPWDVVVGTEPPHDSALNVIHAPIGSITELGNRVRLRVGPLSAEITTESLRRLGLTSGQLVYASFKATGTRVLSRGEAAP